MQIWISFLWWLCRSAYTRDIELLSQVYQVGEHEYQIRTSESVNEHALPAEASGKPVASSSIVILLLYFLFQGSGS